MVHRRIHGHTYRAEVAVSGPRDAHTGMVVDLAQLRAVFEVNFFGVAEMAKHAMPHLRASGGRLITISSIGGAVGQPFNEAYCAHVIRWFIANGAKPAVVDAAGVRTG